MMQPRLYSYRNLMDRLTSDVWFVLEIGDDEFAFAQLV